MTQSTKPRWDLESAHRRGDAAHRLAVAHRPEVEGRLAPGVIDGLGANLEALGSTPVIRGAALIAQKGSTQAERDQSADGHDWAVAIREAARRTPDLPDSVLKKLGVGERITAADPKLVAAAIQAILETLTADGTLAATLGLLPDDVKDGEDLRASLSGAGKDQSDAMAAKKQKTLDKNLVQLQVEAAVDQISSRGALAFRKNPVIRDQFAALVSSAGPAEPKPIEPKPAEPRPA